MRFTRSLVQNTDNKIYTLQERLKLYFKLWVRTNNSTVSRLMNGLCGHSCQCAITTRREILIKPSVIPFKFVVDEQDWLKNKADKRTPFLSIHEYVL